MITKEALSQLSGLFSGVGSLFYLVAILRKGCQPTRSTWFLWLLLDLIGCASMYATHTLNWQLIISTVNAAVVALLSLSYGRSDWRWVDTVCSISCVLALGLWYAFNSPVAAILISMTAMVISAIPTFASAWEDPAKENFLAWGIYTLSCTCILLAVPTWDLEHAAQPVSFSLIEFTMILILVLRKTVLAPRTSYV